MKQITLFIACLTFILSGCCKNKPATGNAENCCMADKDSYEIVMNIPFKIKPEAVSTFKTAFDKCRTETLKEEACLAYDLFQSYHDSTEFHLYERWTDKAGHQNHMNTEHIKIYFKEIEGITEKTTTNAVVVTICPKINNQ